MRLCLHASSGEAALLSVSTLLLLIPFPVVCSSCFHGGQALSLLSDLHEEEVYRQIEQKKQVSVPAIGSACRLDLGPASGAWQQDPVPSMACCRSRPTFIFCLFASSRTVPATVTCGLVPCAPLSYNRRRLMRSWPCVWSR